MKIKVIIVTMLAFCLLLPGCAAQEDSVVDTWPGIFTTATTVSPTETTSYYETILTYSEYLDMSAQERSEFADSFADSGEFFQWLKAVKEIYEEERKENEVGNGGNIDMGQIDPNG